MNGLFISLEGIEGTGKSTQARMLAEHLRSRGTEVMLTREPGGTTIGQDIREILLSPENCDIDPLTELLLYAASRRQHVREVIGPALKAGSVVITDRFSDSTIAYQGYGRGIDLKILRVLNDIATGGLMPELTILLDIDAEQGLIRNRQVNKFDRLELEGLEFHRKVRDGFLAIRKAEHERVKLIPADKEIDTVHNDIVGLVMEFVASGRSGLGR